MSNTDFTEWLLDTTEREEELTEIDLIINELLLGGEYEI